MSCCGGKCNQKCAHDDRKKVTEEIDGVAFEAKKKISVDKFMSIITHFCKPKDGEEFLIEPSFNSNTATVWFRIFCVRPETYDERQSREQEEQDKRKALEELELKEYLRLKKKFGKGQ